MEKKSLFFLLFFNKIQMFEFWYCSNYGNVCIKLKLPLAPDFAADFRYRSQSLSPLLVIRPFVPTWVQTSGYNPLASGLVGFAQSPGFFFRYSHDIGEIEIGYELVGKWIWFSVGLYPYLCDCLAVPVQKTFRALSSAYDSQSKS